MSPATPRRSTLLVLALSAAALWAWPAAATAPRPVKIQLKWLHQFQFAGYYAAIEQGFFAEEGLDVTLIEATPTRPPLAELKAGRVDFAISDTDGLLERMQGWPLVAVSAVFQHSPYVVLSLRASGITVPSQLVGKRVMDDASQGAAQLRAMLRSEGIDPARITFVQHSWNLDDLIGGRVDAITAYRSVEPQLLRARGYEPQVLDARDYGVDFYSDALYTLQPLAQRDPELVRAVVRALARGWAWAFANVEVEAGRILARPGVLARGITLEQLRFEAAEMRPLVLPDVVEVGHMNAGRWERIAGMYVDLGVAPKGLDWSGFVFDPDAASARQRQLLSRSLLALAAAALFALVWTAQLRRTVRQRTGELEREVEQRLEAERALRSREAELLQSQKLEALGQLAGGVAHDFNNLLTVVTTNAELLQDGASGPVERAELLSEILGAGERGSALSKRLLAFARRNRLERVPLDLGAVVEELCGMLRRLISAPVLLVLERGPGTLPVLADKSMLEQVVLNLIVNARDAMPEGGRITLRTRREGDRAVVEVQDEGVGMTPDVAARVFEPFFTTKPVGQGTGLGLSTAYSVAVQHGGTITVSSAPGKGSTFRLLLALAEEAAAPAPVRAQPGPAHARGKPGELLLVVEDDDSVRRATVRTLAQAGWAMREAASGEEALELFDGAVSLVVTDLRMPGIDGVALVKRLRAQRPGLPALVVSGYSDALQPGAEPALPADLPFLQKPYSSEALCSAVRQGLDGLGRPAAQPGPAPRAG